MQEEQVYNVEDEESEDLSQDPNFIANQNH